MRKHQSELTPSALGALVNPSTYGQTIPVIFGRTLGNFLPIWNRNVRNFGGSSGFFGIGSTDPQWIENVDMLLGHNPIAGILQVLTDGYLLPMGFAEVTATLTWAHGDETFTITDPAFYTLIAVTIENQVSGTFNDYGGPGALPYASNTELPMWNAMFAGPDPVNNSGARQWPNVYLNTPGSPVVYFPRINIVGEAIICHFYYAQISPNPPGWPNVGSSGSAPNESPLALLNCTFEPKLGDGPEYGSAYAAEQILYPPYAGVGSPNYMLGKSTVAPTAMPNNSPEVLGTGPVWPTGDADFADMIEAIFKSGPVQAGPANADGANVTGLHYGLDSCDYPGAVQKVYGSGDLTGYRVGKFPLANVAGNTLLAFISQQASPNGAAPIDTAGNSWSLLGSGTVTGGQGWELWTATALAAAPGNTVTFASIGDQQRLILMELSGLDTIDGSPQITSWTHDNPLRTTYQTSNARLTPSLLLAFTITGTFANGNVAMDPKWSTQINFAVGDGAIPNADANYVGLQQFGPITSPVNVSLNQSITAINPVNMTTIIVAFKNSQMGNYPRSLGNILDPATMQMCRNQARAFGLYGSLNMNSQRAAKDWLTDLYLCMNAAPVWSGFKLKSIPMSEASFNDNGTVFTAYTAAGPIANLGVADFIADADNPPVKVMLKARFDTLPNLSLQIYDRNSDYAQSEVAQPLAAGVALFGTKRNDPKRLDMIQDPAIARLILGIMIRRENVLDQTLTFKAKTKWQLLEPMDLITITEPDIGLFNFPVRVTSVAENADFELEFECEPFVYGVHVPIALSANVASGITSAVIKIFGTGFMVGDTLTPTTGGTGAVLTVSAIGAFGAIAALDVTTPGSGYSTTFASALTVLTGAGTGSPFAGINVGSIPVSIPVDTATGVQNQATPYADPGSVNAPIIFEAVPRLVEQGNQGEIWMVVSNPNPLYGGCIVLISTDGGNSYQNAGQTALNPAMGSTVNDWPYAFDPDTANDLEVDLTESHGVLESYQVADEDNFVYPCFVEGEGGPQPEIVAYGYQFIGVDVPAADGPQPSTMNLITPGPLTAATVYIYYGGVGFAPGDTIQPNDGHGSGGVLTVTSVNADGGITGLAVTTPGSGYINLAGVPITVLSGSGMPIPAGYVFAALPFGVDLAGNGVGTGTGFTIGDTLSLSGGGGSGAVVIVTNQIHGQITRLGIVHGGSGYPAGGSLTMTVVTGGGSFPLPGSNVCYPTIIGPLDVRLEITVSSAPFQQGDRAYLAVRTQGAQMALWSWVIPWTRDPVSAQPIVSNAQITVGNTEFKDHGNKGLKWVGLIDYGDLLVQIAGFGDEPFSKKDAVYYDDGIAAEAHGMSFTMWVVRGAGAAFDFRAGFNSSVLPNFTVYAGQGIKYNSYQQASGATDGWAIFFLVIFPPGGYGSPLLIAFVGSNETATWGTPPTGWTDLVFSGIDVNLRSSSTQGHTFLYELMTYALANQTAANKYTLKATGGGTNHLRRAIFGTPVFPAVPPIGFTYPGLGKEHKAGAQFAFLAPETTSVKPFGIFKITMDPSWVGTRLFFKFASFNVFSGLAQNPADLTVYEYTPLGGITGLGLANPIDAQGLPSVGGQVVSISPHGGSTGTGFAVNDTLAVSGGNGDATVIVTSVSGGAITGLAISNVGTGYLTNTNVPLTILTSATGGGSPTADVSANGGGNSLTPQIFGGLVSVTAAASGTGFNLGDTLAVTGGGGTGAVLVVTGETGGSITALAIQTPGNGYVNTLAATLTVLTGSGTAGSAANIIVASAANTNPSNPNQVTYQIHGGALTNPSATEIDMAQATAVFPSNSANYNARTFTIPTPTTSTWYYVTIYDPGFLGDTGAATTLTAFAETSPAKATQFGFVYIGAIEVLPGGGGTTTSPGGSPVTLPTTTAPPTGTVSPVREITVTSTAPGNLTVPHGLGATPSLVLVTMTSGGAIWLQTPTSFDSLNVYLVASDAGVTATLSVWSLPADASIGFSAPTTGPLSIPHGLSAAPALVLLVMTSGGTVWVNSPIGWDGSNIYLNPSDAGVTGIAYAWLQVPTVSVIIPQGEVALAPSAPGNFTVAHGLGRTPTLIAIRMTSAGAIWLQSPAADSANLYLVASDGGITGFADIWTD